MNYIEMTGICNECKKENPEVDCKDGVCKILQPTQNTKEETA